MTSGSRSAEARRPDHEEPEEGAEAQHQDRRVEREAAPLHAHGRGADRDEDRREEERVEAEEEDVADRREGVDAEQPVGRVQQVAGRVDPHRGREEGPGSLDGRFGRPPGRDRRQHGRADAGGEVREQLEDLESRAPAAVRKGQQQGDRYIDEEADDERPGPAGDEWLACGLHFQVVRDRRHVVDANSPRSPPLLAGFRVDICSLRRPGPNCEAGLYSGPAE